MTNTETTKFTRVRTITKRWTSEEELNVLWYIKEEAENGRKFERPTARVYYENLLTNVAVPNANYKQLKNKVANMKKKFSEARKWLKETGNGIAIEGPLEGSIEAHVNGICRHYNLLQDIFAQKVNVVIPYEFDTSSPGENVIQNIIEVPVSYTNNLEEDDIISMTVISQSEAESLNIDITDMLTDMSDEQLVTQATTSSVNQNSVVPSSQNVPATDQNITGQNNVDNRNNEVAVDQSNVTSSNQINVATSNQSNVLASNQNTVPAVNRNNVNPKNVTAVKRNSRNVEAINEEDDLLVCRFKKDLLTCVPCKKHKSIPSNAAAHISDANVHRAEALKERNAIDLRSVEIEEVVKSTELEINKERLRMEKEFQLSQFELKKFEQENLNDKNLIEKLRLDKEHEISKGRLDLETEFRFKELDLQKSQQEKLNEQNMIDKQRLEIENNIKQDEIQLKKDRFLFEKELRSKELDLEKKKVENQHEIEKLKLEYKFKLDLEITKQNIAN